MSKYFSIFRITIQQELAYRANFLMSRVRNIFGIILLYYLWSSVFADSSVQIFGYNRDKILTYVFLVLIVKSLVFTTKANEVAGEIAQGELNKYLVKPINFVKYYFTKDLAVKFLNLSLSIIEFTVLFIVLKPPIFIQNNPVYIFFFIVSLVLAILIFFHLVLITSYIPFWSPEFAWGAHFLITGVLTTFLSGAVFPIDILPSGIQKIFYLLPFPYLVFFPIEIYLGRLTSANVIFGIAMSFFWLIIIFMISRKVWYKGLKVYGAYGG